MFATLLGGLPRPPLDADAPIETLVEAAVRAQEDAGLEPITDADVRQGLPSVDGWEATARLTSAAVKQALIGPYTAVQEPGANGEAAVEHAAALNRLIRELVEAGCPFVEIHEPAAVRIRDEAQRTLFRETHLRLLDGIADTHVSLAVTGGNADAAGIDTLLAASYSSLAVDLIAGPDNWRLVVAAPREIGIVCGALSPAPGSFDGPETLLWAAGYAASTGGRGRDRVGLATASSLAALPWDMAVEKLERLGAAAGLADTPAEQRVRAMDPRAVSSRAAALGSVETRPSEPSDPSAGST